MGNLVIAIDGPSASGKGTISKIVAKKLNWQYLDSGALYRALAYKVLENNIDLDNENAIVNLISKIKIYFDFDKIFVDNEDLTDKIRKENIAMNASLIAKSKLIRSSLLKIQRDFLLLGNLVADGRDMGSIVFPDAILKIFVTASSEVRAQRRIKQIGYKFSPKEYKNLVQSIKLRDKLDTNRSDSPLIKLPDAYLLDNTNLTIGESVKIVLDSFKKLNLNNVDY